MAEEKRQVVTGTLDAAPEHVFAVLADPARHPEIDGSGMCAKSSAGPITGTGQSFVMDMHRDGLGDYQVRNEVTAFEPGRRIAWRPGVETASPALEAVLGDIIPGGHTWSFELELTGDGKTLVTHSYDWNTVHDERFAAFCPFITAAEMSETLSRLEAAAVGSG
jgi:uncharacterized protein YndB with AHSA1/START domain